MTSSKEAQTVARTNVAIRCFRDTADHDYIAARMSYRAQLVVPFLWSSLQALEKFLKCILILNDISARGLGHDIRAAFDRININAPFKIVLNNLEEDVFDHIAKYGPDRYLVHSYHIQDRELLKLDLLVWHLRQFCRPLNINMRLPDGSEKNFLKLNLDRIVRSWKLPPKFGYVNGGKLERILSDSEHPARAALVWKNMRYSARFRRQVLFRNYSMSVNAPLWLHPEMLAHVKDVMQLSPETVKDLEQLLAQKVQKVS